MLHRVGICKLGRIGACLAFTSSILVLGVPGSASAQEADDHGRFYVRLSGAQLEDGGDRDGWGVAGLDFDPRHERVCYVVRWERLDGAVTAFHLHRAPRYHDGPHWIEFFDDEHYDGDDHMVAGCVHASRYKIYAVLDDPSDFYLNIHTTAHEKGAIRGQLD